MFLLLPPPRPTGDRGPFPRGGNEQVKVTRRAASARAVRRHAHAGVGRGGRPLPPDCLTANVQLPQLKCDVASLLIAYFVNWKLQIAVRIKS